MSLLQVYWLCMVRLGVDMGINRLQIWVLTHKETTSLMLLAHA